MLWSFLANMGHPKKIKYIEFLFNLHETYRPDRALYRDPLYQVSLNSKQSIRRYMTLIIKTYFVYSSLNNQAKIM